MSKVSEFVRAREEWKKSKPQIPSYVMIDNEGEKAYAEVLENGRLYITEAGISDHRLILGLADWIYENYGNGEARR